MYEYGSPSSKQMSQRKSIMSLFLVPQKNASDMEAPETKNQVVQIWWSCNIRSFLEFHTISQCCMVEGASNLEIDGGLNFMTTYLNVYVT